ncbi:hypothetical protein C5167_028157 [Papaver somniferum]|nr:hypothetical protein C5167_028157 [Papaver somniferum]
MEESVDDENGLATSSCNTLSLPPGFETHETSDETSDDASSRDQEVMIISDSSQVVPKRLKSEWKRLGVTDLDSIYPSPKRAAKTRGQHLSQ